MLINPRPARLGVALGADRILIRGRLQIVVPKSAVGVVAIGALDQALVHLVVEGHVERRLHVRVALEAERWLGALSSYPRCSPDRARCGSRCSSHRPLRAASA